MVFSSNSYSSTHPQPGVLVKTVIYKHSLFQGLDFMKLIQIGPLLTENGMKKAGFAL